MKDQKTLKDAGDFLAQTQFGVAVVVVSTGMDGDTQKDLVLTEARAMVIREYLVENFGFDDSQLKTLGMGKQAGASLGCGLGLDPDSHLSGRNRDTGRQTCACG